MSILSRLFGGGAKREVQDAPAEDPAESYNGFRIIPAPQEETDGFRVGARIEKDVDGEPKVHQFLRADVLRDRDAAVALSIRKAKQVINEQGARIFR